MSSVANENGRLLQKLSKAESKADTTNRTFQSIVGAAQRRQAKTARLREARLEKEAAEPAVPAPAPLELRRRRAQSIRRISLST